MSAVLSVVPEHFSHRPSLGHVDGQTLEPFSCCQACSLGCLPLVRCQIALLSLTKSKMIPFGESQDAKWAMPPSKPTNDAFATQMRAANAECKQKTKCKPDHGFAVGIGLSCFHHCECVALAPQDAQVCRRVAKVAACVFFSIFCRRSAGGKHRGVQTQDLQNKLKMLDRWVKCQMPVDSHL